MRMDRCHVSYILRSELDGGKSPLDVPISDIKRLVLEKK